MHRAAPQVLVDHDVRPHPGLRVHRGRVADCDVVEVRGCRATGAERTAWDLARRLELTEAVVALDALAHHGRFPPAALLDRRARQPGARGCLRLDRVVALADPRAESPMETRLRLLLVVAGLPRPEVQFRLRDGYGFVIARFDLAYPEARLAVEYDGDVHRTRTFSNDDRWRDVETAYHSWQTLRFTRDDVLATPARTAEMVRAVLARRVRPQPGPSVIETSPTSNSPGEKSRVRTRNRVST